MITYAPNTIPLQAVLDQNESLLSRIDELQQSMQLRNRNQSYTQVRFWYLSLISFFFIILYFIVVCILAAAVLMSTRQPPLAAPFKYGLVAFFAVVYPFVYVTFFDQIVATLSSALHIVTGVV